MPCSHVIKMEVIKILLLISFCLNSGLTFNILGLFPYQGKSHFFVFQPYLQELANRGHNLTVVSYFPQKKPINNYHDISLAGKAKIFEAILPLERSYQSIVSISSMLVGTGPKNCKTLLADEKVQDLWKSQVKFDLVLVEQFNSDCGLGLAYKLGAPVIGLTSHTLMPWSYSRFGIPYNPAYDCFMFLEGGTKPTLYQRIERRIFKIYANLLFKYHSQLVDQNTLAEYFDDVPPLEELGKNMKFMLVYTNFVLGGSLLMPANVIEVGGYHVAKPKELPENLKKFIEESEHGVIYISFGSMLRAISLPREKLDAIIGALSELPHRVIWKWEEDTLPGNPKNIYLSKWLPQNDLLAHPNVVAFYSHCGLLGTTEAIHYGVPVIGMPIFGDQPSNAASIEESGLGVQIYLNELSKENLLKKLQTVLDPKFRNKVKQLSKAWHNRPMSAMDSAIYWTEYAARTANITFRSPAAHVPYYQDLGLDVLAVLAALILAPFFILKAIVKRKPLQTKIKVKKN